MYRPVRVVVILTCWLVLTAAKPEVPRGEVGEFLSHCATDRNWCARQVANMLEIDRINGDDDELCIPKKFSSPAAMVGPVLDHIKANRKPTDLTSLSIELAFFHLWTCKPGQTR